MIRLIDLPRALASKAAGIFAVCALLSLATISNCNAEKIPKPAFDAVVRVVSGAAASAASATSALYFDEKAEIEKSLRARGFDTTDAAVYTLYFEVSPNASDRWFFNPNVFALVQIEGQNDIIPASIAKNYSGQPWSVSIFGKQIRPGGRVLIHILDDKQFLNRAFNSILQMEIPLQLKAMAITPVCPVTFSAGGKIKLLNRDIELQRPGYLATAEFNAPSSKDGQWLAHADLLKEGQKVGTLQFGPVWTPPSQKGVLWIAVFTAGLAVMFWAFFARGIFSKSKSATETEPGK